MYCDVVTVESCFSFSDEIIILNLEYCVHEVLLLLLQQTDHLAGYGHSTAAERVS